mmetsp:Transcript_1228/g.1654  ORF Transcript_1228/g.1654 Transcript_1228/m.1654 type:complete len:506 (-) Transcript_1228:227-1744(-)
MPTKKISAIQFSHNLLKGNLPTEMALLTDLKWLSLLGNAITGQIPTEFAALDLVFLDMGHNRLSGEFPQAILSQERLEVLALSNNNIGGSIPSALSELTRLSIFAVDDNLMTNSLAPLNSLTNLQRVYAEDNGFSDTITSTFLNNHPGLEHLDISNNRLQGTVPVHFFEYVNMTILDLHGNELTALPTSIPVQNKLALLSLQRNGFSGQLPSTIENLQALTHLDVTSNSFTGTMPTFLGDMITLDYLFLGDTEFSAGPIPDNYSNLINLKDLSLKSSSRTGTIPTWIGNLDRLKLLDLDSNRLKGPIPTEIGDMAAISIILLNRNNLSGTIPTELGDARFSLSVVAFDHNNLSGDVTSICQEIGRTSYFSTDCLDNSPVNCTCCTGCCDPANAECHADRGDLLGQFDPIWEAGYVRSEYGFYHYGITDDNSTANRRRYLHKKEEEEMDTSPRILRSLEPLTPEQIETAFSVQTYLQAEAEMRDYKRREEVKEDKKRLRGFYHRRA